MTNELPKKFRDAHLRLLTSLPKRQHTSTAYCDIVARNKHSRGGVKWRKPVFVDGVRYPSIGEASRKTGITRQSIYQRIQRRKGARYAD